MKLPYLKSIWEVEIWNPDGDNYKNTLKLIKLGPLVFNLERMPLKKTEILSIIESLKDSNIMKIDFKL